MTAFAGIPLTARDHFRVVLAAAVFALVARIRDLGEGELLDRHPFLAGHLAGMSVHLPAGLGWAEAPAWWRTHLARWEAGAPAGALPLRALDVDLPARLALVLAGAVEEDERFGSVFAELQQPLQPRRPTLATLAGIIGATDPWALRRELCARGLVQPRPHDGPRAEEPIEVPADLWAILRGTPTAEPLAWAEVRAADDLRPVTDLVLLDGVAERAAQLARGLADGSARVVVVRGPRSSGRRRLLGGLAAALGRGAVFADAAHLDPAAWRRLGPVCSALGAVPVLSYDLGPGETTRVPELLGYHGPVGLVVGPEGGLDGPCVESAVRWEVAQAGPVERGRHWRVALDAEHSGGDVTILAERFRVPSGVVRRLARGAAAAARDDGRSEVTAADVAAVQRRLGRERLDTLASRLEPLTGWDRLAVDDGVRARLVDLELRCRHRERILDHLGPGFAGARNTGVRALLTGPSGTGKTLAARILAGELDADLYRLDLARVVDKYIGETEKNLHRVLTAAEELDVVLLIDEGDSLLGSRTEVRSANDRFANLETNYLLQRLEGYQAILLVTTNAAERIDPAFQRRMDVVLHLTEPGPGQRWEIWQTHLPAGNAVPAGYLEQLAARAEMTGGQIRNAVLQAALFALDDGLPVDARHLERAVAAEYGKAGAVSPFRRAVPGSRRLRSDAFLDALP